MKEESPLLDKLDKKLKDNTVEHTCTRCGYVGVDVHQYPTRIRCKDTSEYLCDEVEDCHARQVTRGG